MPKTRARSRAVDTFVVVRSLPERSVHPAAGSRSCNCLRVLLAWPWISPCTCICTARERAAARRRGLRTVRVQAGRIGCDSRSPTIRGHAICSTQPGVHLRAIEAQSHCRNGRHGRGSVRGRSRVGACCGMVGAGCITAHTGHRCVAAQAGPARHPAQCQPRLAPSAQGTPAPRLPLGRHAARAVHGCVSEHRGAQHTRAGRRGACSAAQRRLSVFLRLFASAL